MENIETDLSEIPLFALSVNVLPGAYLPLQIFEPRYLDMVKDRLGKQKGFCVVLMDDNNHVLEEGGLLQHSATGTYVEVVDFNQLENGLHCQYTRLHLFFSQLSRKTMECYFWSLWL